VCAALLQEISIGIRRVSFLCYLLSTVMHVFHVLSIFHLAYYVKVDLDVGFGGLMTNHSKD
jgi:hypothetical protein